MNLESLLDQFHFGAVILQADGEDFRIRYFNPKAEKIDAIKAAKAQGQLVSHVFPAIKEFGLFRVLQEVYRNGQPLHFPLHFYKDEKRSGWRDNYVYRLDNHDLLVIYKDSSSKQSQPAMDQQLLATAIEQAMESVVITDNNGTIKYVNPFFCKTSGYTKEEALGQNPRILKSGNQPDEFYEQMWQTLAKGHTWHGSFLNRRKDGSLYEEQATISPARHEDGTIRHYVAVKRDTTHETDLENQLRQAQKLEAVGTLAGGIAHDFNNILAGILGYGEMAKEQCEPGSMLYQDLEEIIKAGSRASDLVQQILTFSRQAEEDYLPVQLQFILKESLKMLRASLPATINIRQAINTDCPPILADPTQLQQIIINLCTNAKHAMADGGTISVSLEQIELPQDDIPLAQATAGPYLQLQVSDTGHGMDQQTISKIFEPFFTTKEVGEGTGLGLSVVHGIVKRHHGQLLVESEPEQGATFRIFFPVTSLNDGQPEHDMTPAVQVASGHEAVLVVDDEQMVVSVLSRTLQKAGYQVEGFTNSKEALHHWQENMELYDAVITDMTMPEVTGVELAMTMLRQRPQLPIILATGFSESMDKEQAQAIGIRQYIMKPVIPAKLCALLRQVLDEPAPEGA